MSDLLTIYKIRNKDSQLYSRGRVTRSYRNTNHFEVTWRSNGKEWKSEALIKKHLLACLEKGIDISKWEIMEFTQQPSKSLNEWCDAKMVYAILKHS